MRWRRRRRGAVPPVIRENIHSVTQLEAEVARRRTALDRVSDAVSAFAGSPAFIAAHAAGIAAWVLVNANGASGGHPFDPYPFVFLNLVLAVEAVFLGTFVLMSQNRQNRQEDQRAHLDLQIGLLAEREATKALQLLQKVCQHLGLEEAARDPELQQMLQTTRVKVLAEELQKVREPQPPADRR
jgi:uncharacterized membrane protein